MSKPLGELLINFPLDATSRMTYYKVIFVTNYSAEDLHKILPISLIIMKRRKEKRRWTFRPITVLAVLLDLTILRIVNWHHLKNRIKAGVLKITTFTVNSCSRYFAL